MGPAKKPASMRLVLAIRLRPPSERDASVAADARPDDQPASGGESTHSPPMHAG